MSTQENSLANQFPTQISSYHLRLVFFQYECTYLLTHLSSYLKKIQRHCPECTLDIPSMQIYHSLLQFESTPNTKISAYQLFPIQIKLIHGFHPSELYFLASFSNQETLFPDSFQLLHPLQTVGTQTLLALNTTTGTLPVPSHLPIHQKDDIEVFNLTLSTCFESLQFSEPPFKIWKSVESYFGNLNFPTNMSILAGLPPVQHAHPPPSIPHPPKNLRWSQRVANRTFDIPNPRYPSPHQNIPYHTLHRPEMDLNPSTSIFPPYPPGIRSLHSPHNDSVQTSYSEHTPFQQIPASDTQPHRPPVPGSFQQIPPARPSMGFAVPSSYLPASTQPGLAHPAPTNSGLASTRPSYVNSSPSNLGYRHDTLNNISAKLSQINETNWSQSSNHSNNTDLLYRLNILRGSHSPTVTAVLRCMQVPVNLY